MAQQARRYARIEDDRIFTRFRPCGVQPCDGATPGLAADVRRRLEVLEEARAVPCLIALHGCALASHYGGRAAVAAATVGAGKAAGGRKRDTMRGSACAGTTGVGHAFNGEGRVLRLERARAKFRGIRLSQIEALERGQLAGRKERLRRETSVGIFRRLLRHREAAVYQGAQSFVRKIGRGDGRRALPDEQSKADLFT